MSLLNAIVRRFCEKSVYFCKKSISFRKAYNLVHFKVNSQVNESKIFKLRAFISILLRQMYIRVMKTLEIFYIEFVITTKCTLKCKDCANLLQYYEKPYNISLEKQVDYFDKLTEVFDYIHTLGILGGEPLIYPEFPALISHICKNPKVGSVRVVTNGTLIPKAETLNVLKNPKIFIEISNYGIFSAKLSELETIFTENNIKYSVLPMSEWFDYGGSEPRNRTGEEMEEIFSCCRTPICQSYLNGEFHFCPRSSTGVDLGLVQRRESDYVNIGGLETKDARKQMKKFLKETKFVQACDHCNNSFSLPLIKIESGIQKSDDFVTSDIAEITEQIN